MKFFYIVLVILLPLCSKAQLTVHDYVKSEMNGTVTLYDNSTTNFWGFGRYNTTQTEQITLPGPLLRYNYNDSVVIHYWNDGIDDHTIHLHGLDANQANDGVPFASFAVIGGDSATYSFKATYPGVYLYHCHVATVFHLAMGMYGMLVIDYPGNLLYNGGPGYNKEYLYLSTEMDKSWNDNPASPGLLYDYNPNYFFINGLSQNQLFTDSTQIINAIVGDSILLRLGNIGYTMVDYCFPPGSNPMIYMSDARVLPTPISSDTLRIYPGERYSILLRPTTTIADYICVNVFDMFNGAFLGANYIGINQYNEPTQIVEQSQDNLKLFPNPFTDEITVKRTNRKRETITIFDVNGNVIQKIDLINQVSIISIKDIASGIYFLKRDNGTSIKLVKH